MMRVGFVGWRGMVGSVLMQRMRDERDFETIEPVFFSTSTAGSSAIAARTSAPSSDVEIDFSPGAETMSAVRAPRAMTSSTARSTASASAARPSE